MHLKQIAIFICLSSFWDLMEAGLFDDLFYKTVDNNCTRAVPSLPLEDFIRSAYITGWTYPESRCGSIVISKYGIFGLLDLFIFKIKYYQLNDTSNSSPFTETLITVQNSNKKWEFENNDKLKANKILRGFTVNDVIASNSKGFNIVSCSQDSKNAINGVIIATYEAKVRFTQEDFALSYSLKDQSFDFNLNQVFQDENCPPPIA
ncbi:hypothetical protein CHUAL_011451 [Chamberlinius hualienensis]